MATELRWGQDHTATVDMASVLSKYGKTTGDVTKVIVTIKLDLDKNDDQAVYNKNDDDHPGDVSWAVTTATFTIRTADFTTNPAITPDSTYTISVGLVLAPDANTTFEPDSYASESHKVKFIKHGVDTIAA